MKEQNLYLELWFEHMVSAGRFLPREARQACIKRMQAYMEEKEEASKSKLEDRLTSRGI